MLKAFAPILGRKPKVLILGTMPGRRSLELRQYYGHPQNQFWRLLETALGEPLHGRPYREKVAALKRRGVAVWDVLESCRRPGTSLDSAIRAETPADVERLVARSGVKAVFFNGKSSFSFFKRHQGKIAGAEPVLLPSSSPAYAGMRLADKKKAWRALARFL